MWKIRKFLFVKKFKMYRTYDWNCRVWYLPVGCKWYVNWFVIVALCTPYEVISVGIWRFWNAWYIGVKIFTKVELPYLKGSFFSKGFRGKVDEKWEKAAILKTLSRISYLYCFIGLQMTKFKITWHTGCPTDIASSLKSILQGLGQDICKRRT